MKRLIPLLLLIALPAVGGSYTITTTANQDNVLTRAVARANRETCKFYGQPAGCTQAQARKEFCRRAGFGSVAACDGSGQVNVYADVASYLQDQTIDMVKSTQQAKNAHDDAAAFAAALAAANQAQKDAACVALGLAAGCQ